jgi:hypothetical protein
MWLLLVVGYSFAPHSLGWKTSASKCLTAVNLGSTAPGTIVAPSLCNGRGKNMNSAIESQAGEVSIVQLLYNDQFNDGLSSSPSTETGLKK